jgi:DNA repair exonuclease SbcCD ATPase subunit
MSESQSRYSIVANLTETKLEIITAKSNLDGDTKIAKQKVEQLKEELNDLEESQKEEFASLKRKKEREISNAEREAKNAEEKKQTKNKAFEEKLEAIDKALDKIQAISDFAAKEASK